MSQALSLIELGSKVTVAIHKVRDRIPSHLLDLLAKDPAGTVVDYKMTDGTGVGVVVSGGG